MEPTGYRYIRGYRLEYAFSKQLMGNSPHPTQKRRRVTSGWPVSFLIRASDHRKSQVCFSPVGREESSRQARVGCLEIAGPMSTSSGQPPFTRHFP